MTIEQNTKNKDKTQNKKVSTRKQKHYCPVCNRLLHSGKGRCLRCKITQDCGIDWRGF